MRVNKMQKMNLNTLKMINILMMRVTKSKLKVVNIDNKQINKEINSINHKIISTIIIIIEIHKVILMSSSSIIIINTIIDQVTFIIITNIL